MAVRAEVEPSSVLRSDPRGTSWESLMPALLKGLDAGEKMVVHCKGGLGRAGTVACLLLLSSGSARNADVAMAMGRAVRHGAIETQVQEDFLRSWPPRTTKRS